MTPKQMIYLDNNATTPLDPRVLDAMMPYYKEKFGNASSRAHALGWEAEKAVDKARRIIAKELDANSREIVFTSGATESLNLAIKGLSEASEDSEKQHIITNVIEHKAVLDTCREMENRGWDITYLPVKRNGLIDLETVANAIRSDTLMAIIMHANNEIGTINPIREIGKVCKNKNVFLIVDAAQSFAKIPVNVKDMGIDLLAGSGHKIYGPKGVGFLYVRRKNPQVRLKAQIEGGGHERGMRSGTLPVPLIVGLAKAAELCSVERESENLKLETLRNKLLDGLSNAFSDIIINGDLKSRLPNNLNVCFPGIEGEALIMGLGDIACSTGSACSSATLEPSHVIKALGATEVQAYSAIRFSVGRFTTSEEIDYAIQKIKDTVERMKKKKSSRLTGGNNNRRTGRSLTIGIKKT